MSDEDKVDEKVEGDTVEVKKPKFIVSSGKKPAITALPNWKELEDKHRGPDGKVKWPVVEAKPIGVKKRTC